MTIEQMRITREANPFLPFTVRLADGRSFRVPHRDYLSISPSNRIVVIYQADGSANVLDVLLVTELTLDPPVAQSTNGEPA
jgi:hypothetical protein